jgi:hypothetical protein
MSSLALVRPGSNVLPEGFVLPGNLVRLQVVQQQSNPVLWRLLKRFGEEAPAPLLVNTSFNLFGEPLVVKPRDAVRSFFCFGMDAVVIENFVLSKDCGENSSSFSGFCESLFGMTCFEAGERKQVKPLPAVVA